MFRRGLRDVSLNGHLIEISQRHLMVAGDNEIHTGLDLKLKFTMLSITYLKREVQHQILEKISNDYKIYFNSTQSFLFQHLSPN